MRGGKWHNERKQAQVNCIDTHWREKKDVIANSQTTCGQGGAKGDRQVISSSKGTILWVTQVFEG